jgi:hypothetical protein
MKLFAFKLVEGGIEIDTSKYQLTAGITSLGGAAVSTVAISIPFQFHVANEGV